MYTISLEYSWDEYVFTHERRIHEASLTVPVLNQTESMDNLGYYTKLNYRIDDKLSTSLYASKFYENAHQDTNPRDYQKDVCLSFKYDIKWNYSVKLEYHDLEGSNQCYNHLNPSGFDKDWNLIALKATISF
jgi:hypothetical protein